MHSSVFNELIRQDDANKLFLESQKKSVMSDIISGRIPMKDIAYIPLKYLDLSKLPEVPEHNVLTPSKAYKPFRYEYGYQIWERQQQAHWLHTEVSLSSDIQDWETKLNKAEKNLTSRIFPLFVQNDVLVNNVYMSQYGKIFKPVELQLAISAIIGMESIHEVAYSHLLTELGFSDEQYSEFMEFKEMMDKYNFTAGFRMDTLMGIAVAMLVFGAFTEGLQLFASFAILFNFSRFNKLKGMGQIVSFSVKDESLHVQFVAKLFESLMLEYGHLLDKRVLIERATEACKTIVQGEHKFIDLAFEMGPVEGMTAQDTKDYICHTADMRLEQFGLPKIYNIETNPFEDWIMSMMGGVEHAAFFETRATAYSRGGTKGSWGDVWAEYDNKNNLIESIEETQ
jgi:ribonucleoside-diphosphate reductase beta chain